MNIKCVEKGRHTTSNGDWISYQREDCNGHPPRASVMKHRFFSAGIPAGHALSRCDSVATCFGVGRGELLKALSSGSIVDIVGDDETDWPRVMEQATSMSEARINVWRERIGRPGAKKYSQSCLPAYDNRGII